MVQYINLTYDYIFDGEFIFSKGRETEIGQLKIYTLNFLKGVPSVKCKLLIEIENKCLQFISNEIKRSTPNDYND